MESFRLIFNPDTINRSKAGSITAQIVLQIGDFLFPGEGWSDFIVVILGWWLQVLHQIGTKPNEEGYLHFMDGPYKILIKTINANYSEIVCFEERQKEINRYRSIVDTNDIRNELVGISREVVQLCSEKGWDSNDLDILRALCQ